jgi:NAD(P)-dependent dehydrogenase (short-subunit alcohol dehydrogenase family)
MVGGTLDCLILCHGQIKEESIIETNMLEWDQMMNLNVRPSFQLISLATPFLRLSKGSVTVLSSTSGETPLPGSIIFSTSMSMLNMLVKCASLENAFHGVRVNAVAAGVTATNARQKRDSMAYNDGQNKTFLVEAAQDVPLMNQINMPSDVAKSLLWLASEDASFVTGEIMTVDGGQSLTSNNYPDYLKSLETQKQGEGFGANLFGSRS